ncbi:uncharacterized protein PFB0765w-like [Coccinella septempunctata]|uniref:uncharacterized protein PFB0765w-like n=1 Tax=Coccinella septempunctata TaxID=41139 RepID=UPI001D078963|nr:uncharacterized protein PFB0765w-like [Coccinella septempunctata]
MECIYIKASDEREEGEIVDDDLEEISDDSIVPSPKTGKLNSPEENLRAISLSSVSDLEVMDSCSSVHHSDRRKHRRREGRKRKKPLRHIHRRSSGSTSEDEEMVKTKKLLREAMSRDQEEIHNNSLRTRLKKMAQNSSQPEEHEINCLDCDNLQNNFTSSETVTITNKVENEEANRESAEAHETCNKRLGADGDDELIQLRLEALKTAVINKFQRKKRKVKPENQEESKTLEVNKENSSVEVNTQNGASDNVQDISDRILPAANNSSPNSAINSEEEVDEDILRAVLLASMAKKITNKVPSPSLKKTNQTKSSSIPHKKQLETSKVGTKSIIDPPKIQPIIISINNPDSESEDEFHDQVCAENDKNDNILDNKQLELKIDNFLKQQRAEVEAKANSNSIPKTSINISPQTRKVVKINSLYKFLPQNKQLEYEELIQKLKSAEKKRKVKRLSGRISENKIQKNKSSLRTTENNSSTSRSNPSGSQQKQLRHVQHQLNGRLQDKGKYHELSPLLKKLEEVNVEQKKHETLISQLLKQLKEAKTNSSKLQKLFNELMQDFLKKKEEIDRKTKVAPVPKQVVKPTPKLPVAPPKTNIDVQTPTEPLPIKKQITNAHNSVHCKVILENCPINLEDPNDIEFKTFTKVENSEVPKYSSPLDYMESKNHKILNPMEILCPFEMDGLCRDKDCIYNHCN